MNFPTAPTGLRLLQSQHEFEQLLLIYQWKQPRKLLEVGSANGGTLWAWSHNAVEPCLIVALSTFDDGHYKDPRPLFGTWSEETGCVFESFNGSSQAGPTLEFARKFAPYDWVFIDGDHLFEAVSLDYQNLRPLVAPGGVIVFHDVARVPPKYASAVGVNKLWDKIALTENTTTITKSPNAGLGLGVLFV